MPKSTPTFHLGDRVIVTVDHSDTEHDFVGKTGTVEQIVTTYNSHQTISVELDGSNNPPRMMFYPSQLKHLVDGTIMIPPVHKYVSPTRGDRVSFTLRSVEPDTVTQEHCEGEIEDVFPGLTSGAWDIRYVVLIDMGPHNGKRLVLDYCDVNKIEPGYV